MEQKIEVKTYQIDYLCPKCEIGYLRPNGTILPTYPAQYPHFCNHEGCDYMETFSDKTYPFTVYGKVF